MAGGPAASGGGVGSSAPRSKWPGILMTCFAAFGGILFGYDTGTISGIIAMHDWLCTFGSPECTITTSQQSEIVSLLSAGTFFGALLAAPMADIIGRKTGLIASCLIFAFGVALQTAATAIPLFVAGRVFAGLGVGLVSCIIPMYQSECSPKWIRGAVVSCYQFAITIGLLLAAIINNATKNRPNHSSYRIPIAIQFVWAFILSVGMTFLPESPRFLVKKGRDEAAAKALGRLLSAPINDPEVETELADIRANLKQEEEMGNNTYLDCFKQGPNKIFFRVMTGVLLQAWQQLTGINFIFYYGTTFFQNSGIKNPFLIQIATNVVNVGMTVPGIWAVDRIGRRRLLLIGAAGMCFCEYLVAIVGVSTPTASLSSQRVLVAFVCIYIAFFASTWGPIAWVVIGEIFPLNIRAKAMSLSTASNWLWNWAIAYATPYLVNSGPGNAGLEVKVFFIWGSTCLGCLIFTYFCIPETKGLSLEQIDILYQCTTPRKSVAWRNQLVAEDIHAADPEAVNRIASKVHGNPVDVSDKLHRESDEKGHVENV